MLTISWKIAIESIGAAKLAVTKPRRMIGKDSSLHMLIFVVREEMVIGNE